MKLLSLTVLGCTLSLAQTYDLVVLGGTGGGVTAAARAGRLGLNVLLVNYSGHVGGMLSGGIGVMDTLYDGSRAPLVDEFYSDVLGYYARKYGDNSPQVQTAKPAPRLKSTKRLTFEPHVAETVLNEMLRKSGRVEVLKEYHPVAVERAERQIRAVLLKSFDGRGPDKRVAAKTFIDASYTGDLMALAGADYRVGREDRTEFGEPHAGRIFTKRFIPPGGPATYPTEARTGDLALRPFQAVTQEIFAGSTGEGDSKVQAYHYRLILTNDPANRRTLTKPDGYVRDEVAARLDPLRSTLPVRGNIPNNKMLWFINYSGQSSAYPNADWSERHRIEQAHKTFALSALWFLQNDDSVPAAQRERNREWGLPKDEFPETGGIPYELYIREARRLRGRYVFTEMDATLARGYQRTPVHADSVAVTDWFLDSHEVSTEHAPGSDADGKIILSELTRPGQIPYRALLPKELDNLLVPVCVSSTHVGWGAIRLEPTWMHLGEAAAHAAALAHKTGGHVGTLQAKEVQKALVENGVMIAFLNDADMKSNARYVAALQYLAARGFFSTFSARPDQPLSEELARVWARAFGEFMAGRGDADRLAREVFKVEQSDGSAVSAKTLTELLRASATYWNLKVSIPEPATAQVTRAEAARLIYLALTGQS